MTEKPFDFASMSLEELERNYYLYSILPFLDEETHGLEVDCEWRMKAILKTGRLSAERLAILDAEIQASWREFQKEVAEIPKAPREKAAE